jgi:hypothetical protein
MPRPGPRPYECVRRAWHSDRHQPMRASLIQRLFRMANQVHSPATRKNQEWQEKLPFVVLKAEEIIYSKANSEAEYMDENTLCERANDAIDTIIRKDDSTETGALLQPCIEAALILGCVPRRASRSQRYSNPGCYLNASTPVGFSAKETIENNSKSNSVSSPPLLLQCPVPPPLDHAPSSKYYSNPNPNFNQNLNPNGGVCAPTYPVLLKPGPSTPNGTLPCSASYNHSRNYGGGSENGALCQPYNGNPSYEQVQKLNMAQKRQMEASSSKSRDLSLRLSLGLGMPPHTPTWFDSSSSDELEDAASTSSYDDTYKLFACPTTTMNP